MSSPAPFTGFMTLPALANTASQRSMEVLRILYFYGPHALILVGLVLISATQSQGFLLWAIPAIALMIVWRWISPRMWRDTIIP